MNINELTIGQAREIAALFPPTQQSIPVSSDHPYKIGAHYLIRTVTMINTGRILRVTDQEIEIDDAAWIPDTGRFSESLISRKFNECEPYPDGQVIIGRGSVVDAREIKPFTRSLK